MKKYNLLVILLSFWLHSNGQNSLRFEYDSCKINLQKGNLERAIFWVEKAKISAKSIPNDTNSYIEVLKLSAIILAKSGKNSEAELAFKESISLYELMPSKKNQLAALLQNFGTFYYNQKKYEIAEMQFLKSSLLKSELSGEKNPEFIQTLNSLSSCYLNQKKHAIAYSSYSKLALLRKEITGENNDYLVTLQQLANISQSVGNNENLLIHTLEIEQVTKNLKTENSKEYALSLIALANVYKSQIDYSKAENLYLKSSEILQRIGNENSLDYAFSLANLGAIYRLQSYYEKAEPLLLKSQSIIKSISGEESKEYAEILNNLALYNSEIGKYEISENYYKIAIEITKKKLGEKHLDAATTYSNLGLLYKNMGRFDQAETLLKRVVRIRKEILGKNSSDYASSLNNLAGVYESMNRISEAQELYKQSVEILKLTIGEKSTDFALTLNNLAGTYEQTRQYSLAEPLYINALDILKSNLGESHPDYSTTLNNLALLQESMGKSEAAIETYRKNLEKTKLSLGEKHPNYVTSLSNYATLLASLNKYTEAEPLLLKVLEIRKEILSENHPSITNSLYEIAKLYSCMKKYTLADNFWDKALGQYLFQINAYFPSMSEKEKSKFYSVIYPKFEQYNSYVLLRYLDSPLLIKNMFTYQIATKALLLNSSNKIKQRILASNDAFLISKFRNWTNLKEQLAHAASLTKEELLNEKINLESLSTAANDIEKELSSTSELFRNENEKSGITWLDIQKKLKQDEAAVEIIRFPKFKFDSMGTYSSDSVFYAALIFKSNTQNNPELIVLKNGVELEKQMSKYYRNAIKFKNPDELSYLQYWARFKKSLGTSKIIYFSPDGVYNQLNINTFQNTETKNYISDEYDIRVQTNLKDLLKNKSTENINKKINIIGNPDFSYNLKNISAALPNITESQSQEIERASSGMLAPLPGTKIEIDKINSLLSSSGWKSEVLSEANATEERLKSINNPKVLHIATHGFFDQDTKINTKKKDTENEIIENPLLKSGIFLAGASMTLLKRKNEQLSLDLKETSKEDGILTAYEAMNLSLENTDLVILSACETGLGELKNGEGVYGLQRAFNIAGVKSIITSLWTVSDNATQELMFNFYQEWIKTNNKRTAFKNAQSILRKKYPEPYYWGAFVMIGD